MVMLRSRCGAPNGDCTDQSGKLSVHSSENIELSGLLVVILFIIGWEMLDKSSGYGVTAMPLPATLAQNRDAMVEIARRSSSVRGAGLLEGQRHVYWATGLRFHPLFLISTPSSNEKQLFL